MTSNKKIKEGQTVWDLSLVLFGSIEGVFDLLNDNPNLNLENDLITGNEVVYSNELIRNKKVFDFYNQKELEPATKDIIN